MCMGTGQKSQFQLVNFDAGCFGTVPRAVSLGKLNLPAINPLAKLNLAASR